MKLKYDFEIVNAGEETVAVAVGDSADVFHGVIKLNETGKLIFENLKNEKTAEEIVNALFEKYNATDRETIENAVNDFLKKLGEAELLINE